MNRTLTTLLALASLTTTFACDTGQDGDDAGFRSVTVKDKWAIYTPTTFPEVNSCVDYWNDRCASLTPAQCTIAKNRYSCAENSEGVEILDNFGYLPVEVRWAAVSRGDKSGGVVEDLQIACESMGGIDYEQCLALAEVAEACADALPEIMESSPGGGVATIIIEDELMRVEPELSGVEGIMWKAADALHWTVPMLRDSLELEYPMANVFEDDIILMVRPNGTLSVSTDDAVFMQDTGDGDCEGCEVEMPMEELIMLEELPPG